MFYDDLLELRQKKQREIEKFVDKHCEVFVLFNRLHIQKERINRMMREEYEKDHPHAFSSYRHPWTNEGNEWIDTRIVLNSENTEGRIMDKQKEILEKNIAGYHAAIDAAEMPQEKKEQIKKEFASLAHKHPTMKAHRILRKAGAMYHVKFIIE